MSARINQRERGKHTHTRKRTRIAIWTADCQKLYFFIFLFPWLHAAAIFLTVKERPEVLVVSFHQPLDCRRQDFSLFHLRIEQGALQQPENKGRKKGKGGGNTEIQMSFLCHVSSGLFSYFYFFIFSDFTRSRSLHSPWLLTQTKVVNWVPWQIFSLKREYREGRGGRLKWKYRAGEWMTAHTHAHMQKRILSLKYLKPIFPFSGHLALRFFYYLGATPGDMDGKKIMCGHALIYHAHEIINAWLWDK